MYDLAILGASPEGISAARRSISHYPASRIALITQGWERVWTEKELIGSDGDRRAQTELVETLRQLAALGVDVISAIGQLNQTGTELRWEGEQRGITARAYLLTTTLEQHRATHSTFGLVNPPQQPNEAKTWGIWGAFPRNLVLAQTLAQQGHGVQLFTRNASLLPGEDREMSQLLQSYLEALGVKVWRNCHHFVRTLLPDIQKYQLAMESGATSCHLLLDQVWQPPLPALPWHWLQTLPEFGNEREACVPYLVVNDQLQTAHSQLFACGGWLQGYPSGAIALQEAHYVVERFLGNNQGPINYAQIPFGIALDPPWYRVGLSQQQATAQWEKIHIYHGYEPYQGDSPLRGVCKILSNSQDQIVGAHWFGPSAPAGISLLTLAIAAGLSVATLKNLPVMDSKVAQVLQDLSGR
jgi:pyruvate/2-oxoglutarate dehydrogenase complex dihydrolipoamide dehydrogenase (E3) component